MAIYRVLLDGVDIYDPTSKGMVLIDPVVHTEAGAAGNFEFTMPPMHVFYNNITPYGSSIEVLEDGQSIFFGRPLKPKIGFYNQKTYHCEGALAFLNDSRPTDEFVYEDTTPAQYFRDLIAYHNSFQSKQSRKFTVGNITVSTDWNVYREMTPSMTILEHIKRGCVGSDGGYLFTRRVNGVTYIDWTKDMPYTCNQTVEFALNLLDMSRSGNEDIYTGVMLKGGERRIKQNGKIFNSVVQYGPMWGSAEAIAKYGEIIAYQEYPDIDNVDNLIAAGEYFLMTQQFESMLFEVSAAEQHYLNASLDMFKAGQKVRLVSNPHFVDIVLPVQSVEVRLDSAEKKVTLGTVKRQTLTKIQRKTKEEQEIKDQKIEELTNALEIADNTIDDLNNTINDVQSDVGGLIDNQGVIQGDDGNLYHVGVDENGNVYATKIPTRVYISHLPDETTFSPGENCDWTGLVIMGEYNDGTTEDMTQQFTITPASGTSVGDTKGTYNAIATMSVGGKEYTLGFEYSVVGQLPSGEITINGVEYNLDEWQDLSFRMYTGNEFQYSPTGKLYTLTKIEQGYPEPGDVTGLFKTVKVSFDNGGTARGQIICGFWDDVSTDPTWYYTYYAKYEKGGSIVERPYAYGGVTMYPFTVEYNGVTKTGYYYNHSFVTDNPDSSYPYIEDFKNGEQAMVPMVAWWTFGLR